MENTSTIALNEQQRQRRISFRFRKDSIHLTYETHLSKDGLIDFLKSKGRGFKWYSVVHETSQDNYQHTHFACQWVKSIDTNNQRYFDFNGIHPNITHIANKAHAIRIYEEYHHKDGIPTQSEKGPTTSQSLVEQIREAPSLAEAIEISGVEIKSVSDLVLIRNDIERKPDYEHSFPDTNWTLRKQFTRVLFIHGPTGTGKTQWAVHQFTNPLLVSHIDSLKNLTEKHDGIVFDDMSFAHLPRESVIHLLDWDEDREIHCRYRCATIPKHTRKIFTSNKTFAEVFPYDETNAIRRRITDFCHVTGPTYNTTPNTDGNNTPTNTSETPTDGNNQTAALLPEETQIYDRRSQEYFTSDWTNGLATGENNSDQIDIANYLHDETTLFDMNDFDFDMFNN